MMMCPRAATVWISVCRVWMPLKVTPINCCRGTPRPRRSRHGLDEIVLDHRVGEQALAHLDDPRLGRRFIFCIDLDQPTLEGFRKFISAWLYRVATNAGYDALKTRKRRWQRDTLLLPDPDGAPGALGNESKDQPKLIAYHLSEAEEPTAAESSDTVEEIIEAFNTELKGILTDGTFAQILQLGWIQLDVDGDGRDEVVALGDQVGLAPPGSIYDVFGTMPETPPEKQRFFIQGNVYEGWDAIPEQYKAQGPADPMDTTFKQGTTLFTLQF